MSSLETTFTQRALTGFTLKYGVDITGKRIKLIIEAAHNVIGVVNIKIQNAKVYNYYYNYGQLKTNAFNGDFKFKWVNANRLECDLGNFDSGSDLFNGENIVQNNGSNITITIDNTEITVPNNESKFLILFDNSTPVLDGLDGAVFGFKTIESSGSNTPVLFNETGLYQTKQISKAETIEGQIFSTIGTQGLFFIEDYAGKNVNLKTRIYER